MQQPTAVPNWDDAEFQTYCPQGTDNCVQFAKRDGMVAVRSTRTPGKIAELTDQEWADLKAGVLVGDIA